MLNDYIHFSQMLTEAEAGEHQFTFVAKGTKKTSGGYRVTARAIVTSSNSDGTINLKVVSSGQVRKIHKILITEFDKKKVIL